MLRVLGRLLKPTFASPDTVVRDRHSFVFLVAVLAFLVVASGLLAEVSVGAEGELDGRVAISIRAVEGFGSQKFIDLEGFEVQFVPETDLDTVLSRPAGEWFTVPVGKYKFWLEGPGWITPYTSVLNYRAEPFRGKGISAVVPVVPAGRVALDAEITLPPAATLRLIHVDSHNRAAIPQRELSRPVPAERLREGVPMPEGEVVAALYEPESRQYLALSQPIKVTRDALVAIRPVAPRSPTTDLLVRLERPGFLTDHEEDDIELAVRDSEGELIRPAVQIPTVDRIYAIWYGLSSKQVTLEVYSASVFFLPENLILRPGRVENHLAFLQPLPDVEVQLDLPESLKSSEELALEVRLDRASRDVLRQVDIPSDSTSWLVEDVPARKIDMVLSVGPWLFHQPVDLSDGQDATVYFSPEPIDVSGTVYLGDDGHPAIIEFQTTRKGDTLRVAAGASGHYQAELFRAGYYLVNVYLEETNGPPSHAELLERPIREDVILDFRLPNNGFTVRVEDAETGESIAGAETAIGNIFVLPEGPLRNPDSEKSSVFRTVTDREGISRLRPVHPGELTVRASAEGYLPSDLLELEIEEGDPGREIVVSLEPVLEKTELRVLLPDGKPAGHAEVRLQMALGNTRPLWTGAADREGFVELPKEATEAWALFRHPAAGSSVLRLSSSGTPENWTLSPIAPPLSVEATRPWGDPASWAQFALWVDGEVLSGQTLAWFAGASPAADATGLWQARSLPASPLKILAWAAGREIEPHALESLVSSLSYPWQALVQLETID